MIERSFILDTPGRRDNAARFISKLQITDRALELVVRPYIRKRTTTQNSRLWALHAKAAEHTGHSAEEMHEFALMRYFGTKEIVVGKLKREVPIRRSSDLDRKEFRDFMDSTESWYIDDFGVWLEHRDAA